MVAQKFYTMRSLIALVFVALSGIKWMPDNSIDKDVNTAFEPSALSLVPIDRKSVV